jgi:uncharacterized membrane protein YeaQ/YmgE (transglycosylase-associated protein family)
MGELNTEAERKAFQAGYIAGQSLPESGGGAMIKIMRRLGIVGASYGEIADHVCKRLDGCEALIDKLREVRK